MTSPTSGAACAVEGDPAQVDVVVGLLARGQRHPAVHDGVGLDQLEQLLAGVGGGRGGGGLGHETRAYFMRCTRVRVSRGGGARTPRCPRRDVRGPRGSTCSAPTSTLYCAPGTLTTLPALTSSRQSRTSRSASSHSEVRQPRHVEVGALVELGVGEPRAERRHGDPASRPARRRATSVKAVHPRLGRGVGAHRHEPGDRRDVDDRPVAARPHRQRRGVARARAPRGRARRASAPRRPARRRGSCATCRSRRC